MTERPRTTDGGWTGGQYSLLRALFGAALALYLARLLPWAPELFTSSGVLPPDADAPSLLRWVDDPASARAAVGVGALLAVLFALGLRDRWAALGLWVVWASIHGRNPLVADSGAPFVGWVLLFHAALPTAPFGSLDARGRMDPRGEWSFPRPLRAAAWTLLALTTTYNGLSKLASSAWRDGSAVGGLFGGPLAEGGWTSTAFAALPGPLLAVGTWAVLALQLGFAPLALLARARPWLWGAMTLATIVVALGFDSPDASLGRLALLGLCFEPRWIAPLAAAGPDRVFYDGACGFCHRAVRFAVAEDRRGSDLRFAPIDGETFRRAVPGELRPHLPDSILVVTGEGELLDRSRGALRIARRMGGLWRLAALAAEVVPLALRDTLYDGMARVRHRLFASPEEACPLLPRDLRERFEA